MNYQFPESNLNHAFEDLVKLVLSLVGDFKNIRSESLAISLSTSRSRGNGGLLAYIVPLRYIGGKKYRRGKRYGVAGYYEYFSPHITRQNSEALYLLTILVPKFFRLSSEERLETIVHELYHIHPLARGDLRRFPAPHVVHGPTPREFQKKVLFYVEEVLRRNPKILEHPLFREKAGFFVNWKKKRLAIPKLHFKAGSMPIESAEERKSQKQIAIQSTECERTLPSRDMNIPKNSPQKTFVVGPPKNEPKNRSWTQLPLFSVLVFLFLSLTTFAGIPVKVLRDVALRERPMMDSTLSTLEIAETGEIFQAVKQSRNRRWVYLSGASGRGWVPKSLVRVVGVGNVNSKARGASQSPPQMAEYSKLPKGTRGLITRSGQFFSEAKVNAEKFSRLEKSDDVILMEDKGEWSKIRLGLTGEEGWYPRRFIYFEDLSLEEKKTFYQEDKYFGSTALTYGSKRLGFGLGVSLGREITRFNSGANIEAVGSFNFHFGESTTVRNESIDSSFSVVGLDLRYNITDPRKDELSFFIQGGVAFFSASHVTSLSQTAIDESGVKLESSDFVLSFGGGLYYPIKKNWRALALVKTIFLPEDIFFYGSVGAHYRF